MMKLEKMWSLHQIRHRLERLDVRLEAQTASARSASRVIADHAAAQR